MTGTRKALAAIVLLVMLAGCATTVRAPADVAEPARVALLDHGHHATLVIETPGERPVRYAYGDWRYYAEARTGAGAGTRALLFPTDAALGRKELPGPLDEDHLRRQVHVPIEHLHVFAVEAAHAQRLREELDLLFASRAEHRLDSAVRELVFVPHPLPYTLRHNSNGVVAIWLARLGAEIEGRPVLSNWRVVLPE